MWSSRSAFRNTLAALGMLGAVCLAGCTSFTPVYGEHGVGIEQQAFNYAKPQNRLDQIIYQELALRLGRSSDPAAPTVRVTTTSYLRDLTLAAVRAPSEPEEAVVTALVELLDADGKVIYSGQRSASAQYMSNRQALSEAEAEREATERASKSLAETIRLTLIGARARPAA